MAKKIMISVGEASGDLHASNLVRSVLKHEPQTKFYGMGGSLMQKAGVDLLVNCNELSLIGVFEIFTKLPKILHARKIMQQALLRDKPNLLILVDYAGFNLPLAKYAKNLGIKVLYYISPKLWASRPGRVKQIKKYVDMMAVIFPFEVDFYRKHKVPVQFVGNPLTKTVKATMPKIKAKKESGLNARMKTIGLLPGSRKSEIKYLLPVMLEAAQKIKTQKNNVQFILPLASSLTEKDLAPYLQNTNLKIQIIKNKNYDVMNVCDAIIVASGTATLEVALMKIPMVITYKVSALNYWLIKMFIKIPYVGLCNIVAQKMIVRELLQRDATPEKLAKETLRLLDDKKYRNQMIKKLQGVKTVLKDTSAQNTLFALIQSINK